MIRKLNSVAIGLTLITGFAAAQADSPEIIEETDTYRTYADGSIERKETAIERAEAEVLTRAEIERQIQKQDSTSIAGSTASAVRGTLAENAVPGLWKGFGGVPYGCNGDINVIERGPDGKIYLGGFFSACNDVIVNNITAWDPATNTFEALGLPAGVDSEIRDMVFAANGDLIVVGNFFSRAGNVMLLSQIVRWDGSSWSSVGEDFVNSSINAIEIDPDTGRIYVGGFFTQIFLNDGGSLEVNRIAVWDGTEWSALGDGFDNSVESLQLLDGILYAGGRFSESGTVSVSNISAWDGTAWSDVGGGTDNTVEDLTTDGTNLFAGGFFDNAGGVNTGAIARWDGTQWNSIDGPEFSFGDMHYTGGKLYVTGGFSSVDGASTPRVAIWDGSDWSGTADSSAFEGFGTSIFSDGSDIIVGGSFSVIGTFPAQNFPAEGTFANRIARFDGATQQWGPLGDGQGNNLNGPVSDILKVDGEVWVVGRFTAAGTQPVSSGLARWSGSEWLPAPGDNVPCGAFRIAAVGPDNEVFTTTSCNSSNVTVWENTARFDGSIWQPLDEGLQGSFFAVFDVTVDTATGDAYYSGTFTETGGENPITVNRIGRWDGMAWNSVGSGPENGVSQSTPSFVSIDSAVVRNGNVMVEGFFDRAGTAEVDRLALWNGSVWGVPGDGLKNGDRSPDIRQLEGQGTNVFAAGFFSRSGTEQVRNIAEWNGVSWVPLQGAVGEGVGFTPRALHATPDRLYVGGDFVEAGGRPAQRIARWDGEDWRSLGAGNENGLGRANAFFSPIEAMQSTADGVFMGGRFGGSSAVTSPNLIWFVPMENLDLAINADVTGIAGNQVNYEITIVNNGEFALVDSSLVGDWSPQPTSVSWTCTPVAPATRGCTQNSGSGSLNQVLEVPAGATVRFAVTVDADVVASPFLDFTGTWSAAPVAGATGTTQDSVLLQSILSSEGVFKDDFEG